MMTKADNFSCIVSISITFLQNIIQVTIPYWNVILEMCLIYGKGLFRFYMLQWLNNFNINAYIHKYPI